VATAVSQVTVKKEAGEEETDEADDGAIASAKYSAQALRTYGLLGFNSLFRLEQ
jgi:hypothetical protein